MFYVHGLYGFNRCQLYFGLGPYVHLPDGSRAGLWSATFASDATSRRETSGTGWSLRVQAISSIMRNPQRTAISFLCRSGVSICPCCRSKRIRFNSCRRVVPTQTGIYFQDHRMKMKMKGKGIGVGECPTQVWIPFSSLSVVADKVWVTRTMQIQVGWVKRINRYGCLAHFHGKIQESGGLSPMLESHGGKAVKNRTWYLIGTDL